MMIKQNPALKINNQPLIQKQKAVTKKADLNTLRPKKETTAKGTGQNRKKEI